MLSISHWGMFAGRRFIGEFHGCAIFECDGLADDDAAPRFVVPSGYRLPSPAEVYTEMTRRDGLIRLIKIEPPGGWFSRLFGR